MRTPSRPLRAAGPRKTKWTEPAPKYGPTAEYGDCEASTCRSGARTTCATCEGHYCLGHAEHSGHA